MIASLTTHFAWPVTEVDQPRGGEVLDMGGVPRIVLGDVEMRARDRLDHCRKLPEHRRVEVGQYPVHVDQYDVPHLPSGHWGSPDRLHRMWLCRFRIEQDRSADESPRPGKHRLGALRRGVDEDCGDTDERARIGSPALTAS